MNYLAHAHLSRHDEELMVGQMLGDFLERGWRERLPPRVIEGVRLHQKVDRFTDTHTVFARSRRRLGEPYRLYAGVLVDVFYDHFLARHWNHYHPERELSAFTGHVYEILKRHEGSLTGRLRRVLPSMSSRDWLGSYGRLEAVDRALLGISRRLSRPGPMADGGEALREHYGGLETDFHDFFPQLEAFVEEQTQTT